MISLMTFLGDQNLINLVKGAFRIRSCYQTYKECALILTARTAWRSDFSRRHFESGVRMGVGTFNLMISHMPSKVLKLLEFIGFSGNRATGFTELEAASELTEGLRSPLAVLISMTYHCYVEHYFGLGEGDLNYSKELLDRTLDKYPNVSWPPPFKHSSSDWYVQTSTERFFPAICWPSVPTAWWTRRSIRSL